MNRSLAREVVEKLVAESDDVNPNELIWAMGSNGGYCYNKDGWHHDPMLEYAFDHLENGEQLPDSIHIVGDLLEEDHWIYGRFGGDYEFITQPFSMVKPLLARIREMCIKTNTDIVGKEILCDTTPVVLFEN